MASRLLLLSLISGLLVAPFMATVVQAQITPDGTLNTTVTQSGLNTTITNGTAAGTNLYHSFGQFSVPTGGSATFNLNATPAIRTIFSRVTGGSVSNIDGLIRTLNSTTPVSLFLINPAGILFGANARLNIGGSFVATTANSVIFADGVKFNATEVTTPALLTISVPIGLQLGVEAGAITVQGSGHQLIQTSFYAPILQPSLPVGLTVQPGQTLAFVGSSIALTGGILTAPSGQIELGSVSSGTVNLNSMLPQWVFDYSQIQQFADIRLLQQALVNASGAPAGSIQLQGRNISLLGGSVALLQNFGGDALGNLVVNAAGLLEMKQIGTAGFQNNLLLGENLGTGAGSHLNVSAQNLVIQDGGVITTKAFTEGRGGDVKLTVSGALSVDGWSAIDPTVTSVIGAATLATGDGGEMSLVSQQVYLTNGGNLLNLTAGTGRLGKMTVVATDRIEVSGENPSIARTSALATATLSQGNGGDLTVTAPVIRLRVGGGIGTSSVAAGKGGNLTVNASNRIEVSGVSEFSEQPSRIVANVELLPEIQRQAYGLPFPTGNAGELLLNTPLLQVSDRGIVAVSNGGTGNAGNLKISADRVNLDRAGSITATTRAGEGGNINLQIHNALILRHGSRVSSNAGGVGDGGNITINAPIIAGFENSDIIANAVKGRGGNIQITTQGIFGLKFRNQLTPDNDITASSEFGVNGNVQISNLTVDPSAGIVQLPVNLVDPSQQIATGCNAHGSRFVATGRGGLPPHPSEQVGSDRPWSDIRAVSASTQPGQPIATKPPPIIEATGFIRLATGESELITLSDASLSHVAAQVTCAGAAP